MDNHSAFNNADNDVMRTAPQSSSAELSNGENVDVPHTNLAASKGALAAERRAQNDDTQSAAANDYAIPQPATDGALNDEPLLHKAPVYAADGKQLGTVSDRPSRNDYLVVQQGKLFVHDLYVPRGAVDHEDTNGIYLAMRSDEIKNLGWENEPPTQM